MLPNYLTLSRLILSPVFIVLFLVQQPWGAVVALATAVFFEVSDVLDGWLARRCGLESRLGKLLDPLADSVSRMSVFLALTTEPAVRAHPWPILIVAVLFYRDAVVAYVRTFAASAGTVLAARFSGKLKAVVQGVAILGFLSYRTAAYFHPLLQQRLAAVFYILMLPVLVMTAFSGIDYVVSNRAAVRGMAAGE